MDKELAEKNAKLLAENIEIKIRKFLLMNPLKKLKTTQKKLIKHGSSLDLMVRNAIKDLEETDAFNDSSDEWQKMDERIWNQIRDFQQTFFETFLCFNIIHSFFNSPNVVLNEEYTNKLRTEYKLTPVNFRDALLKTLDITFSNQIKRGGKKGFWNDNNKLEFLALYNRFLIVIKNVRLDIKSIIKKSGSKQAATKETFSKYEIPDNLREHYSPYGAAKDIALEWAALAMNINFKEHQKDILKEAKKIWLSRIKEGLIPQEIIEKMIEKNPKTQINLIDIKFEPVCQCFAIESTDENKKKKLKYVGIARKRNDSSKFTSDEEFKEFFVGMLLIGQSK